MYRILHTYNQLLRFNVPYAIIQWYKARIYGSSRCVFVVVVVVVIIFIKPLLTVCLAACLDLMQVEAFINGNKQSADKQLRSNTIQHSKHMDPTVWHPSAYIWICLSVKFSSINIKRYHIELYPYKLVCRKLWFQSNRMLCTVYGKVFIFPAEIECIFEQFAFRNVSWIAQDSWILRGNFIGMKKTFNSITV